MNFDALMQAGGNDPLMGQFLQNVMNPPRAPHPAYEGAAGVMDEMLGQFDPMAYAQPQQPPPGPLDALEGMDAPAGPEQGPQGALTGPSEQNPMDFLQLLMGG